MLRLQDDSLLRFIWFLKNKFFFSFNEINCGDIHWLLVSEQLMYNLKIYQNISSELAVRICRKFSGL